MKGSARAGSVIAAPVKAEDRLLKVCASVADKNNCASPSYAALDRALAIKASFNTKFKALYAAVKWMNVHNPN